MKNLLDYIIRINDKDNVAIARKNISSGEYKYDNEMLKINNEIKVGFKIALKDIKKGELIFKYGFRIGVATKNVKMGNILNLYNIQSLV